MPYIINDQHRNTAFSGLKSQWLIPPQDEISCFDNAMSNGWLSNSSYWGVHAIASAPTKLGISPCQQYLYIARFVNNQADWHGYPVAHWLSPFDKPAVNVLSQWVLAGYITKAKKAKIHRGKICFL